MAQRTAYHEIITTNMFEPTKINEKAILVNPLNTSNFLTKLECNM